MAKNKVIRQVAVSLSVLALCGGLGFGLSKWAKPPKKEPEKVIVPLVESRVMVPESVSFSVGSQGVVRPAVETALVAEVAGVVTSVSLLFVSGGVFKKGDTLARIDDSDYRVAVRQAEASLAASQAKLAEESARSEAEKKSWIRSGNNLDDAPALLVRTPFVAEAEANVKAASAQLEKARRDLERTLIRAPYDGMVREREINLGQFVTAGGRVGAIFSTDYVEVRLPLKPSDLMFIPLPAAGHDLDSSITVRLSKTFGTREMAWSASLSRVEGIVDEQSRMHYVVARVNDPYGLQGATEETPAFPLKAGSFVSADLQGSSLSGLFSIPRKSVYGDGQVLVIDDDNSLRFRKVSMVYADEQNIYVNGGLNAGDRVCLTPLSNPVEGMRVRIASVQESDLVDASLVSSLEEDSSQVESGQVSDG